MENKSLIDNPFYIIARDAFPFLSKKHGTERVAMLLALAHDAGASVEDATDIVFGIYPMTIEELKEDAEMVENNMKMFAMMGGSIL